MTVINHVDIGDSDRFEVIDCPGDCYFIYWIIDKTKETGGNRNGPIYLEVAGADEKDLADTLCAIMNDNKGKFN